MHGSSSVCTVLTTVETRYVYFSLLGIRAGLQLSEGQVNSRKRPRTLVRGRDQFSIKVLVVTSLQDTVSSHEIQAHGGHINILRWALVRGVAPVSACEPLSQSGHLCAGCTVDKL